MRTFIRSTAMLAAYATPLLAQEGEKAGGSVNLLAPSAGLMFWTLLIFGALFFVLKRYFYPLIISAVAAREQALREALAAAQRDRTEAERVLAEHKAQLDAARGEAQKIIADGRAASETMRSQMLEETKRQQDDLLARAKRDIDSEKVKAIVELRREAIDLAIKGAGKVIEKNLDDATNRKLVEGFFSSLGTS
jgi:F-type H+-transporting ATPase subunit b